LSWSSLAKADGQVSDAAGPYGDRLNRRRAFENGLRYDYWCIVAATKEPYGR